MRRAVNVLRRSSASLRAPVAAASVVCAATLCPAYAQVAETVLYSFLGGSDGGTVYAPVIADLSGPSGAPRALYGTTGAGGGSAGCFGVGCGTVFKLIPTEYGQTPWTETVLGSFSGGTNGDVPLAGLFARKEQISQTTSLYGTTSGLGGGPGTVFKVTGQTLTTIWNFTGGSDGSFPQAGLIADEAADEAVDATGALYGTAGSGGSKGCGTVYKLTPPKDGQTAWTEQTLWSFLGGSDGCFPAAPLIADERGALYGTTYAGGGNSNAGCFFGPGCGTVFKLTPPKVGHTAWSEQTLWSFSGGSDGSSPFAGLIVGKRGALYGTTSNGGATTTVCGVGCGVVFQLTPPKAGQTAWNEQTLWNFSGGSDGGFPLAGLLADGTSALYGTTSGGGTGNNNNNICFGQGSNGVVFRLTPPKDGQTAWTETTLWAFSGASDGCFPVAPLIADERGAIYGTTQYGGSFSANPCLGFGCGVVFRLTGTGFAPGRRD